MRLFVLMFFFLGLQNSAWAMDCLFSEITGNYEVVCDDITMQVKEDSFSNLFLKLELIDGFAISIEVLHDDNGFNPLGFSVQYGLRSGNELSKADKKLFYELKGELLQMGLFVPTVFDFFLTLPESESLTPLMVSSQKFEAFEGGNGYTMICNYIGRRKRARYQVKGIARSKKVRVGRESSNCYGRCGSGCGRGQQYTQECLNHDVCNRTTGENLGVCSDEFWAASKGYWQAPNCSI